MEINEKNINIEKSTIDIYWKFPNGEIWFTNKYMKKCLSSCIIKYMQTKVRYSALSDYQIIKWVIKTVNDEM